MLVWILIMTFVTSHGAAVQTAEVSDRSSCERAGQRYVEASLDGGGGWVTGFGPHYSCTQVWRPK